MCLVSIAPRENVSDEKQIFNEKFYLSPRNAPPFVPHNQNTSTRGQEVEKRKKIKRNPSHQIAHGVCVLSNFICFLSIYFAHFDSQQIPEKNRSTLIGPITITIIQCSRHTWGVDTTGIIVTKQKKRASGKHQVSEKSKEENPFFFYLEKIGVGHVIKQLSGNNPRRGHSKTGVCM